MCNEKHDVKGWERRKQSDLRYHGESTFLEWDLGALSSGRVQCSLKKLKCCESVLGESENRKVAN